MANALDAVLALKAQETQKQQFQSEQLSQAADIFLKARQLKQQGQFKQLELAQEQQKMDAAKNDPLRQILEKGKLYEARKNILEGGGGDILANQPPIDPVSNPIGSAQQTVAKGNAEPLIPDKFNSMGVPTSFLNPAAEKKKNELELEKSKKLEEQKPKTMEVAGLQAFAPQFNSSVENIKSIVNKDDFKWGIGQDFMAAVGNPMLMKKDSPQQLVANELNKLKKAAFGEGGKQLTNTEKEIVFRAFEPQGLSIGEWVNNLEVANQVLQNKNKLVGGKEVKSSKSVFSSVKEAEDANLPFGTIIYVRDDSGKLRKAKVE